MTALDGVTVLDLGHMTAGPLGAWLLGSLGAEVIKIEPPSGDGTRDLFSRSEEPHETGGYIFHSTNAGKQSVVLDLKTNAGRAALFDLAATADVVVENYRPGTAADLGISYEQLSERNSSLIYCSITGYGNDNAGAEKRAYDSILQALTGMMTATGYEGDPPTKIGVSVVDNLGAFMASVGVVGALLYRDRTGDGQFIDISMQDCAAWLMQSLLPFDPVRTAHQPAQGPARLTGVFEARDGWILLSLPDEEAVESLGAIVADEESVSSNGEDDPDIFEERVKEWTATRAVDALVRECTHHGVAASAIANIDDVIADRHLDERGAFVELHGHARSMIVPVSPYRTALSVGERSNRGGPALGEHTRDVLSDLLSYNSSEIEALVDHGEVGGDK